ncbi:MAG: hypothetical protein K0U98_08315 [Deltaproteobacteria bacterium]|nr:hypothetical protein [Deltaproteobacteria bacterium]
MDWNRQESCWRIEQRRRRVGWEALVFLGVLASSGLAPLGLGSITWAAPAEDPPLLAASALSQWRHIGIKSVVKGPCPDPGYPWSVRHLFGLDAFDWSSVPAKLRPFCVYQFTPSGPVTPAALSSLSGLALSSRAEDAMALTLQADSLVEALRPPLEARFLDQGRGGLHLALSQEPPTRLAILDTSPDLGNNPGGEPETSRHGETLQRLAKAMACAAQEPCLVEVVPRLSLAYISFDPWDRQGSRRDTTHGGFLGLLGDLAEALYQEVREWQGEPSPRPLVINLSIGWDGELFGGLEGNVFAMPPAVQAVYQALEYAACQGAVTIAAAGNYEALRGVTPGPLLPAAWERRPRSCQDSSSAYQPLVFAAAAIRADGNPLPNARPLSSPPLVAYGDHATAAAGLGRASAVLTGSSVASVLVATSAAALWHHRGSLDGPQIMDQLHQSGDPLAQAVDFACFVESGEGCPAQSTQRTSQVHRVSLCSALDDGCDEPSCQPFTCTAWVPASNGVTAADTNPYNTISALDLTQIASPATVCAGQEPLYSPAFGEPLDPCPFLQYSGARTSPWLHPQPGMDPCPVCLFVLTKQTLSIEIDEEFQGELEAPTLQACGVTYSFNEIETPLVAGDRARVDDLDIDGCTSGVLSFKKDGGGSTSSTVLTSE